MKITLLYQVSRYIRVKKLRNIKSWDQQNYLVIRWFCYIWPLYNEVPTVSVIAKLINWLLIWVLILTPNYIISLRSMIIAAYNAWGTGADLAFFQGGGVWLIVHEPRSGEPVFFFWLFYEPRSGEPIFRRFYEPRSGEPIFFFGYFTSREAASRFFFGYFDEPRSGKPIFFWLFWTPVSDVFLASTNAMETMITSLAAKARGGGGGLGGGGG